MKQVPLTGSFSLTSLPYKCQQPDRSQPRQQQRMWFGNYRDRNVVNRQAGLQALKSQSTDRITIGRRKVEAIGGVRAAAMDNAGRGEVVDHIDFNDAGHHFIGYTGDNSLYVTLPAT